MTVTRQRFLIGNHDQAAGESVRSLERTGEGGGMAA